MPSRKPLLIGPFSKGINHFDDPTAIQDTEVVEAINFDPGLDGSLRSRPPFFDTGDDLDLGATGTPRLLGYYYSSTGVPYLLASDGLSSTWQYSSGSWSLITATFAAADMAQFDGKAWLVPPVGATGLGGSWTPSGGFTVDADMPVGTSIVSYKQRLWIAEGQAGSNPTRVRYSKVLGQPSFWASPGFMDVGSGDGQAVIKLVTYFDVMLIFRSQSIWAFQYGTDPANAIQSVIVPGVGLENKFCVVAHENYLYFMFDEKAYEFVNNRVQQLNVKVPFSTLAAGSTTNPFTVSAFNNRILYSYYETVYVYSLRTRTWTTWVSTAWGPIGQVMSSFAGAAADEAFALPVGDIPGGGTRTSPFLQIQDWVTANTEAGMQCILQTKNYNFEVPGAFKVLFWWGVDTIFRTQIKGQAIPVVFNLSTTWGQLLAAPASWADLLTGTWAHPYLSDPSTVTNITTGSGPPRKFVRFLKKLRFRQISFRLVYDIDGSQDTSPVQVFTISAYMDLKQTVSKTIS